MNMRYKINFDKTVNQLVPHFLGGRKLILYLQSLLYPLQQIADEWKEWAEETRIEASMTSQIFKFEWFLNRRFSKYFYNPGERITIVNTIYKGLPLYFQSASIPLADNPSFCKQEEDGQTSSKLYSLNENPDESAYSFIVNSPAINSSITRQEYVSQLQYWIDRYRLAGKTYTIKISE